MRVDDPSDRVVHDKELGEMLKQAGIDFNILEERIRRSVRQTTGAAVIFGASGGVMEAALERFTIVTGKTLDKLDFTMSGHGV